MTETAVQENNTIQNEGWFIPDNMLTSYVSGSNDYSMGLPEDKQLSWFNFNLNLPLESEVEAKEKQIAIQQQVQLGIITVVQQPQIPQQSQQPIIQNNTFDGQVLPVEVIQFLEMRITPAFITMLNGKEVELSDIPTTQQPIQESSKPVIQTDTRILKPVIPSLVDEFVNKAKDKYSFRLDGKKGKTGRNDPCPCGSLRKFKECHGR